MTRPFDVLLAGYFGFGNLGDELLAKAAADNLTALGIPRGRIAALSNAPDDTASQLGIEAFDRWNPRSALRAVGMSRSLLLPGGGIFQDASSLRSCVYYWSLIRAASFRSVPVGAIGQSVGPLNGQLAKFLTKSALSACGHVSVRDSASADALGAMGLRYDTMPDPVLGFDLPECSPSETVLINMRPEAGGAAYVRPVVSAAKRLGASGAKIIYVAMSGEDAAFMRGLSDSDEIPRRDILEPKSLEDFSEIARQAGGAIGMRLHFGMLSMLSGLGIILSPYDPKVASFAAEWNITLFKKEYNGENFDIMRLLTNSRFGDKKKLHDIRLQIAAGFKKALGRILGEDDEFGKTRRT
jgi:polysaccharide pyruvyl transferase CsaB